MNKRFRNVDTLRRRALSANNNLKQNTAITLIALVITIIVLLILAAVTLNFVLGENGIIAKAKQAKGDYENSKNLENQILDGYENELNKYVTGKRDDATTIAELNSEITTLRNQINAMSSAITVCLDGTFDVSLTTSVQKVSLDYLVKQNGTILTPYDGGIKVGKGISCVEISGSAAIYTNTSYDDCISLCVKNQNNEDKIGGNAEFSNKGSSCKVFISPIILDVEENEVLYMYAQNTSGNRGKITKDLPLQTRLTVRAVQ